MPIQGHKHTQPGKSSVSQIIDCPHKAGRHDAESAEDHIPSDQWPKEGSPKELKKVPSTAVIRK